MSTFSNESVSSIMEYLVRIDSNVTQLSERVDSLCERFGATEDLLGEDYADSIKELLGGISGVVSNDQTDLKSMVDSFKDLRGRLSVLSDRISENVPPTYPTVKDGE